MTGVYPKIAGTDHNSLLVCLCLVEKCVGRGAKDTVSYNLSSSSGPHIYIVSIATSRCINTDKTSEEAQDIITRSTSSHSSNTVVLRYHKHTFRVQEMFTVFMKIHFL